MPILIVATLLSLLLFAYPVWRVTGWFDLPYVISAGLTLLAFSTQFVARFGLRPYHGRVAYSLRAAADFFLGLSPVLLAAVAAGEIVLLVFAIKTTHIGFFCIGVCLLAAVWGLYRAWFPELISVELSSNKLDQLLSFVQISDVHIGSKTSRFLNQLVRQVNQLQPDFLCITGDFIDQPGVTEDKLSSLKDLQCPVFYCTGNHERYEDFDQIMTRLKKLGVNVLRNQAMNYGQCQIIGIDDHDSKDQVARVLPFISIDPQRYSLLLYHRPQGLEAAAEHGIDLKISGHTHNGQIKPFNLAVKKVFEYTQGLYQQGNTYLYVNEGTGTWGPTLRLGTKSEITQFTIAPSTDK